MAAQESLEKEIASLFSITELEARNCIKVVTSGIISLLSRGYAVRLTRLGTFRLGFSNQREKISNLTGEKITVPERIRLNLYPPKRLLMWLTESLCHDTQEGVCILDD